MILPIRHSLLSFTLACAIPAACQGASAADTPLSLSQTARVPGAVVDPGSYSIHVVDRLPDRFILELSRTQDDSRVALFLAIPEPALPKAPLGRPVFWQGGGGSPSIRGIWLRGMPTAAEFVFPKAEAAALAKQVDSPVPAIDPESENKPQLPSMSGPDREVVTLWLLSTVAVTPGGSEKEIKAVKFQAAAPALVAGARAPRSSSPTRLPKTATDTPLLLLGGFCSFLLGAGLLLYLNRIRFTLNRAG